MEKPLNVRCEKREEPVKYGGMHIYDKVLSASFSYRGKRAQLLVNYMPQEQSAQVETGDKEFICRVSPEDKGMRVKSVKGLLDLKIPAESAIMLEWDDSSY